MYVVAVLCQCFFKIVYMFCICLNNVTSLMDAHLNLGRYKKGSVGEMLTTTFCYIITII